MNPAGLFMISAKAGVPPLVLIARTGWCRHGIFSFHNRAVNRRAVKTKSPEIVRYPEASLPYISAPLRKDYLTNCTQLYSNSRTIPIPL